MDLGRVIRSAGAQELLGAWRGSRRLLVAVIIFSFLVNALTLTGPLYMLQVYDRVLGSRSEATLVVLSALVVGLFMAMGILDFVRSKIMSIIGARFQERLDRRIFSAAMRRSAVAPNDPVAVIAQRDLEAIRVFISAPVFLALVDLPLTPLFAALIFIFHPLLGWLSILGGAILIAVTLINQQKSRRPQRETVLSMVQSERMSDQLKSEAETMTALGMFGSGFDRWQAARQESLTKGVDLAGVAGAFAALTRTFRMFLQSAMLGAGAWVVLKGEMSGGAMMASSILMGKTLAPIEVAVGQWAVAQRAYEAWKRLSELLTIAPVPARHTRLPHPVGRLEVEGLTVAAPGERVPILRGISFTIPPGQAVGVIGVSGSGKSTLARALTGAWPLLAGKIRLGGASLDQYDSDVLGRLIGYVPQHVTLFEGTIADNIGRLDLLADSDKIVAAAQRAGAHEMILKLAKGYDTWVSPSGTRLSGGQIQRIGLARAVYGNPVLLVLDEPTSNLDQAGSSAFNTTVKAMKGQGACLLIAAHRPASIQECELLLVIEAGMLKAIGPRDDVLRQYAANHAMINLDSAQGSKA